MARTMVGQRKPALTIAIHSGAPGGSADAGNDDTGPDSGDPTDGPDDETARCPNCGCEFNDETQDVLKPGAKVVGGPKDGEEYQGKDLSSLDSAEPTPGKFGAAHDAAGGTEAMAALLNGLRGGR